MIANTTRSSISVNPVFLRTPMYFGRHAIRLQGAPALYSPHEQLRPSSEHTAEAIRRGRANETLEVPRNQTAEVDDAEPKYQGCRTNQLRESRRVIRRAQLVDRPRH